MKKFLVVLLSLGLIAAFAAPASAADVKFSGTYYVVGVYDNNPMLANDNGYSRALIHQRFRANMIIQVQEGLSFTGRFDALEKHWGDTVWKGGNEDSTSSRKVNVSGQKVQESIEFEQSFLTFKTAIGDFKIGYMSTGDWGTEFMNNGTTHARAIYSTAMGPLNMGAFFDKWYEADSSKAPGIANDTKVDADYDIYGIFAYYKYKGGDAGLRYTYYRDASAKPGAGGCLVLLQHLAPYFKATFGPVYVEGEVNYIFGKAAQYEAGTPKDIDAAQLGAYIRAKVDMGPAWFGGQVAYISGNDPNDPTKSKEFENGKDTSWQPLLIIGGSNRQDWMGNRNIGGAYGASTDNKINNFTLFVLQGGYRVTPKLNLEVALGYAKANQKPMNYVGDTYGTEADLKVTYKIFDNLSYFVGTGYLWSGDFYKGTNANASPGNDYVLMNQLMLNF